jgi:selenocysteine lyase/cysteine desulfurase
MCKNQEMIGANNRDGRTMRLDTTLDVAFCRSQFPALDGKWVFLENAGGTLVPRQVIDRTVHFMAHCQVQPGEGYEASELGAERIAAGRSALAAIINAEVDEIVAGPSTTSNVYVLSHALRPLLAAGDEIIVTNQDHEANNGAWRQLETKGIVIREWLMNGDTDDLEIEDLEALLTDKTQLVCFTHCSNIVGLIHDVKEIVARIHAAGALACVDGVAFAPHRRVDVKDLDVDFYLYSPYKVFGPHMGVLYAKRELLCLLASQSHYLAGIAAYLDAVYAHHFPGANVDTQERLNQILGLFADHERALSQRVEEFLASKPSIRLAGGRMAGRRERVGVFSFLVDGRDSREIPERLRAHQIGLYADDFYAARCIDALGARAQNGFVRASLVHYNSADDVERLIAHLEPII